MELRCCLMPRIVWLVELVGLVEDSHLREEQCSDERESPGLGQV